MKSKLLCILLALAMGVLIGVFSVYLYESQKWKGAKSMNSPTHSIDDLKYKVWSKGDIDAYRELELNALDESPDKFLFWSLYMANKYNYANAYWDVYFTLEETYGNKVGDSALYKMDEKTRRFALDYLKMAAQKGDSIAVRNLREMKSRVPAEWLQ